MKKVEGIRQALKKTEYGLWIMQIARETGISKSTVHRYLSTYMKQEVEVVRSLSDLIKLYKLKALETSVENAVVQGIEQTAESLMPQQIR